MSVIYVDDSAVPYIHGGGGGGGCFAKETLIDTEFFQLPISEIEVGDKVWAYDEYGRLSLSYVTETFYHPKDDVFKVTHEYGTLHITKNHWVLKEDGTYQELGDFVVGDCLLTRDGKKSKINSIEFLRTDEVYNFKVSHFHSYIADNIKVHNGGGGGKSGGGGGGSTGVEDPNSLFSSDFLFLTLGLGEGPLYRINPNGPQDFELNEGNIEDLLINGQIDQEKFFTLSNTGTLQQQRMPVFGDFTFIPQRMSSTVELKKGNLSGVPRNAIDLQNTSVNPLTALKFYFIISGLQEQTDNGDIVGRTMSVKVTIFDRTGTTTISEQSRTISGKTNTPYSFDLFVSIPQSQISDAGYKFTVEKISNDNDSSKIQENVALQGWSEIIEEDISYTRTATLGFALKAFAEHKGAIPAITSLVKGLLVKVPSNYNQPILTNGDIDWRELEVSDAARASNGYRQQKTGTSIINDTNPVIYDGLWDGQFVYSWTQNPAWIIYDLLTNSTYGLNIPEENIDKYTFYEAAVYCDACDVTDGKFYGVDAIADGTFRYKPRNTRTTVKETLIGLDVGVSVKERRFILDVQITDQKQVVDLINILTITFRALLYYTGGKISLFQERPDELPVAVFNESNIKYESINIKGISEDELLTGVDISYLDATNHYRRDVLRVDDSKALSERNNIENISQIDLEGVTRKSQALRLAQFLIADSKFSRRSVSFTTGIEAAELRPGDIISVSQRQASVAWGFGGIIAQDSETLVSNTSIYLEHIGSPSIPTSFFTGNTNPLTLRVSSTRSGLVDSYIISNTNFTLSSTDNVYTGFDVLRVEAKQLYDHKTKSFNAFSGVWKDTRLPRRYDLWTLGEINNPTNIFSGLNDKLFKIIGIRRNGDEEVEVEAKEYISNVYIDSDTIINYDPLAYTDLFNPLLPPPTPNFDVRPIVKRELDGSIFTDIELAIFTDLAGYTKEIKTEFFHARPQSFNPVIKQEEREAPNIQTVFLKDIGGIEDGQSVTLFGKNGASTELATTKLLVTSYSVVDIEPAVAANANGFIELYASGFRGVIDKNFGSDIHVLEVNDGSNFDFGGLKGTDRITVPINQKAEGGTGDAAGLVGFVGSDTRLVNYSANVVSFDKAADTIKLRNDHAGTLTLSSLLPDPPFYVSIPQVLDVRFFSNNTIYLTGTTKEIIHSNVATTTNIIAPHTFKQPLGYVMRHEGLVKVFVNGIPTTDYSLEDGLDGLANSQVSLTLSTVPTSDGTVDVRVVANTYMVPAFEVGDNLSWNASNVYGIADSSYDPTAPSYNAWLTSNGIFRVTLDDNIKANVSTVFAVNISPDVTGTVGNVNEAANSFTIDYNRDLFNSNLALGNSYIYAVNVPSDSFDALSFGDSTTRLVRRAEPGVHIFKARNVNKFGRKSPFNTKTVTVRTPPIQAVSNLSLSEELYRDTTFGVAVRVIVVFDHITGQEVSDYEISFKVTGTTAGEITSFNTIKVPAAGVDSDGKIRVRLENIERGLLSAANNIVVRVTPLNKNIRGSTLVKSQSIIGKTAPPKNVLNFAVGQSSDTLVIVWTYLKGANNDNFDIDLKEVQIRRVNGDVSGLSQEELLDRWARSDPVATVDARTNRVVIDIDQFGEFTYLVRTVDTSGIFSEDVVASFFKSISQQFTNVYRAFSEDDPGGSYVVGVVNSNSTETNYASFYESNTGGLAFAKADSLFDSSITDNANGTSVGFSVIAGSPTDLRALGDATYITQIRDVGNVVTGSLATTIDALQSLKSTWLDFNDQIGEDAITESAPSGSLRDINFSGTLGIGNILGVSNAGAAAVSYGSENKTLVSGLQGSGPANVYAIIALGNFDGDDANANVMSLIAGTSNANTIVLGESWYSNGRSTGSNGFANLEVAGTSYKLVNLKQYQDLLGTTTFFGTPGIITSNLQFRTSTVNPFYANGNVNVAVFSSSGDGFTNFVTGARQLRYFQFKYRVTNSSPAEVELLLDKFRYSLSLEDRAFSTTIATVDSQTFVDYSVMQYTTTPKVTGALVIESSNQLAQPQVVVLSRDLTGAWISSFFSNGVSTHNVGATQTTIDFSVTGV